jgi:hypothetical protein
LAICFEVNHLSLREPGGIMSNLRFTKSFKKFVGIAGVAGVSTLLGLPALAQMAPSSVDTTPAVCLPRADQVTPIESPTGGATMEQMQANNNQSMTQSNIGTSTYYGQSLPSGNRQINYLSRANNQSSQLRMSQVTPTWGPAGGYTMERYRAMNGDDSVMSNMDNNQSYNYNRGYRTSQMPSLQGPAGGYSAGMLGNNDQTTYSSNFQSRSLYRVSPSMDASDMSMNQQITTRPMPGSMSSDRNRPMGELTPEAAERISEAIGGC